MTLVGYPQVRMRCVENYPPRPVPTNKLFANVIAWQRVCSRWQINLITRRPVGRLASRRTSRHHGDLIACSAERRSNMLSDISTRLGNGQNTLVRVHWVVFYNEFENLPSSTLASDSVRYHQGRGILAHDGGCFSGAASTCC